MPRARNIKPGFFKNDALAEIEPLGRLFWAGLWTLADFKGELEWRPKKVKAEILPYDNCDVVKIAINLDKSGFIRFYSDGDKIYLKVVNFEEHQNPHKNERDKGSKVPKYSEEMRQAIDLTSITINRDKSGLEREDSASDRADSLSLIPDSLSLIPDPLKLIPDTVNLDKSRSSSKPDVMPKIINHLNSVAGKNFKPTETHAKHIRARIAEGHSVEDIMAVIDRKVQEWSGTDYAQYIRPSTLFNAEKFNQYVGEIGQPLPCELKTGNQPETMAQFQHRAMQTAQDVIDSGFLDDLPD